MRSSDSMQGFPRLAAAAAPDLRPGSPSRGPLGAMCLLAALAAAAMLPSEADAQGWLSPQTGYRITTSHVTEGNDFSVTIKLEDAKGRSLPENTRIYTTNGTKNGFPQATAGTDYTAYDQDHSFNLNTSITFTISTTQDETIEGDEIFVLVVQPGGSGNDKAQVYPRINNDDLGTITISDQSVDEGGNVTFTAKHTGKASAYGFKATPTYTNGTAESGDYTANTTQLSFSGALNEEKTFTVSTTEDAVLETNETVTVGFDISGQDKVKYGTVGVSGGSATLTINNDEDAAAVTVNDASASEGDDITFTISLNNAVEGGLTVSPGWYTNGTAASGDYTENITGISFNGTANETKTFKVSTTEDAVLEANETFTVGLGVSDAPSGVTSTDTGTGTINNDDSAAVTVNDASASEGESMTFTVTLSEAVQGGLTVTPSFTDVSAVEGTDYDENTSGLSFTGTKGETKTFTVSTTEDAVFEGNETFTVGLSVSGAPSGVTATDTGTGTVNNDDSAAVTVNDASANEGGDMTFTVTLSEAVQGGLKVTPSYTNGTAASTDYTANVDTLTFTGTKDEQKTFKVATTEDEVLEANETLTVDLTVSDAPSGVTSTDTGTGTINNDDSAEVTINDASASEGDSLSYTVTLSEAVQGGLTVTPSYTNGTAASTDYKANTTALTFAGTKGETESFKVATKEDAVLEANETLTVGLTVSDAPSGVTSTDTGSGTINNDDSAEVTIADAEADEGDDITFTITLDEAVQGGLTVTPDFTDVTAVEGTDYDENTTAITFTGTKGETQTFTVSTDEDAVLESDETFTVGLAASGAPTGTSVTDSDEATGTIDNDDSAEVTIADAKADEGDDITFTVTLDEAVQGGLTVTPDFTDGTAVESTDYDENTAALTFTGTKGETQTFTVSTTEDAVLEADETFTVGLTASGAPTGTSVTDDDEATGTVGNDDGATVTVNDASASEGNSITFTVTLGAAVQGGLTVTPDFTDVTAVEGTDYDENTAALSFTGTANETKTFTVATDEDAVLEADETFTVGLTASDEPAGTSVTDTDTGTGTVNNDDSAEITINDAEADEGESMTFTVTLSEAVQDGLTVTPDFTDVTADEGTDYDENTAALTFTGTKGETKSFTVSTDEDAVLESDETFTVGLSVSNHPTGTTVTATDEGTGTIDNDDSSEVTVNDAEADEGDAITFTVTLSEAVQDGLTVTPGSYANGTAESGDYTANTAALSFTGAKGETKTFTVSTTEDAVLESDETFTLGLSVSNQPSGTTVTSSDEGTGTIENDDRAEVTVNDAEADEGDAITFTVTLSEAVEGGVTVTPGSYTNGTAASGDYTANTAALTFTGTKGETRSFTVSTNEDGVFEADETFTLGLTASNAPSGTTVTDSDTGTGTITNDDQAAVTVDDDDVTEGGTLTFTVTLSNDVQGGLTVTPGYTDVSADKDASKTTGCLKKSGSQDSDCRDYTANTGALAFTGAKNETKSFTVSTVTDGVVETDETFTVDLTVSKAPPGVDDTDTGAGTIDNDDEHPKTTVTGPSKPQKGEFDVTITFTKQVKDLTTADLTVVNGTAMSVAPGGSGSVSSRSFGFASAQSGGGGASVWTATIEPAASGEVKVTVPEEKAQDEYGNGNVASSALSTPADLIPPTLSIQGPSRSTGLDPFEVTIPFSEPVTGFEQSDVKVSNGSATAFSGSGKSYKASITPAANGQVTVWVETDAAWDVAYNGNDKKATYSMQILLPPRDVYHSGEVTIDDASADEGGDLTFTVSLDKEITGGFKVTPVFSDSTASAGSDYTANTKVLTFAGTAGESHSFTVSTASDGVVEGEEIFTIGLTVADGPHGLKATDTGAGTIRDVQGAGGGATVTIDDAAADEGGDLTFTVSLDRAVQGGFTVTPAYSDSTATAGSDYTANTSAMTFTGQANESRTFTVATLADGAVESDEIFTVGLTLSGAPSGVTATDTGSGTIRDDDTAPSVALSGPSGTQTGSFDVTVTFSTAVTGFEQADLSVTNGSVSSLSGTGSTYTAAVLPGHTDDEVTLSVAADAAVDSDGNGNTASSSYSVSVDLDGPSVAVTGPSATQTGSFDVAVIFSEPVTGFEAADLTVAGGSVSSLSGSDSTYTATILPGGQGHLASSVTVSVAADAATDAHGHGNTASSSWSVSVDLAGPSAAVTGPSATQTGSFDVTVTFTEAVTGFEAADLTVTGGSVSSLSGADSSYTATILPGGAGHAARAVTVSVAADAAEDAAGHGNTASADYTVAVDLAGPSVALTGPSAMQTGSFDVAVVFSEAVTGFEAADLSVTGGSVSSLSGSDSTYTAAIRPDSASSSVTVSIGADAATDAHGHGNTASADYTVSVDVSGPSAAVSGPTGTQSGAFTVTVTFSEAVTGFEAADLSVTGGSATSLSGSGSSYTAAILPAASGSVTVSVPADAASDAAGHGNTASAAYTVSVDLAGPAVAITGPSGVQGGSFDVQIAFSEAVTGFEPADLSVTNGSVTSGLSGSGSSYGATIRPAASGPVTVSVAAGAAADAAGHDNTASAPFTVTADLEAPTVSLGGPRTVTGLGAFDVTVTFSESVTGFETADLSVTNGSLSSLSGSGSSYTASVTPASTGALTVSAAADAAVDAAGHGNASGASVSVRVVEAVNRAPVFSGTSGAGAAEGPAGDHPSSGGASGTEAGSAEREVAENTPAGTDIGAPVAASDPDGDALTYTLSGPDASAFDLDSASGQLRTKAALDYESRASYAVIVTAGDGRGGTARQSVAVTVTDEDEPPPAPDAPAVAAASTASLTVTWTAPAMDGRPPVTGYDLHYRTDGGSWTDAAHDGLASTAVLAGLSADTAYEARVRARNDEGVGPWSAPGSGRTPAGPTVVVAPAGAGGAGDPGPVLVDVALALDENVEAGAVIGTVSAAGGGDAPGYTYTLEGPDAEWFELDAATGQLRVVTALDYETRSSYTVVIVVSDGRGGVVRRTVTVTVADRAEPPPAPDAPALTAVSPSSLTAAWTAPEVSGAPPVTGYDLAYRAAGTDTWTDAGHDGAATTATLTGLSADTAYEARVRARNDEGVSPWSAPGQGRTQMLPLAAPVLQDQEAVAGTAFRYEFDAVAEADGYRAALADGGEWPGWLGFDAGTRTFAGTPPAEGSLQIEVTARDDRGRSASATFTLTVAPAPLAAVEDEAAVDEGGSVRIDVLANDRGLAGRSATVTLVEAPAHGTAQVEADGAVTYTHDGSETTADKLRYRLDAGDVSSEATVTLAVTPVNDAPVADAGEDQEVEEGAAVQLSGAGTDAEGQTLTFAWTRTDGPAVDLAGADSAEPTFTAPDDLLEDAALVFELTVTDADGAASAPDAVTVTVAGRNDAPVFGGPYTFTLDENQDGRETPVAVGQVSARDPEGRAVTYALAAAAERFALDAATGQLTYTGPGEDAETVDAYTLTADAQDPDGAAASVEVTVTIGDVDEPGRLTLTPVEPEVGQAVQAEVTDPDGPVTGQTWQWSRSREGRHWQPIDGAAGDQYTPVRADIGLWLSATVDYEVEGASATLTKETDAPVTAPADDPLRRSALAAVGRSVAEEVVETLSSRMQAARNEDSYFIVNGHRADLGPPEARTRTQAPPRAGDAAAAAAAQGLLPSQTTATRSPSAFRMSMDDSDRWTLWGRESIARFDGRDAGFGFDARMMSGFVGLDYRRRRSDAGMGLALAHNRSDIEFGDSSRAGDARIHLTHLLPYAHWSPKAGLDLWSLAGLGRGQLDMAGAQTVGLRMAAAGLRWDLRSVRARSIGRIDLAARADAFAVSLRPKEEDPAAAQRVRLALEGRSHWQVNAVESVRPGIDLGLRWDGGDADRGAGLELAGELAYANALHGVNVEARARRLLVHQAGGFRQWGASLVFRRESGDRCGLQMSLGPQWGESGSQVRSLWQGDQPTVEPAGDDGQAGAWNPDEITFTSGYGLGLSRAGRLTPFLEAGAGRDRRLRLGTRWEWNAEGTRQIEIFGEQRGLQGAEDPDRGVQVQAGFEL